MADIMNTENATINFDGPFSTIDIETFEGAQRTVNAINNSQSLNDYIKNNGNEPFTIVDIVMTPGVRKGRNGQQDSECEDTRLILADNTSLLSQSDGIARSARFIAKFLYKSLHDGIMVRVVTQALATGNTVKNLEVVGKAK